MDYKEFNKLSKACPWLVDSPIGGENVCGARVSAEGFHGTPCMYTMCAFVYFDNALLKRSKIFTREDERG